MIYEAVWYDEVNNELLVLSFDGDEITIHGSPEYFKKKASELWWFGQMWGGNMHMEATSNGFVKIGDL